jgi:hypothetical protein
METDPALSRFRLEIWRCITNFHLFFLLYVCFPRRFFTNFEGKVNIGLAVVAVF